MSAPTPDPAPETDPAPDADEEKAYGKFKAWLDRYAEESKPADPPPEKTKKPSGGFLDSIFNM